jgi:hypothetical protein
MGSTNQAEIDERLRRVRDLIFLRELLAERGATEVDLVRYDAVIADARNELAESARAAAA